MTTLKDRKQSPSVPVSDDVEARSESVVALTPVSLHQTGRTVRGVFFPEWQPSQRWALKLTRNEPWVFCCNRRKGEITFNQARFTDRDELRAAIVLQLALAWDFGTPGDALIEKLEDATQVALSIRRPRLAATIDKVRRLAGSGNLDMLYDQIDDVVRTYNWVAAPGENNSVPVAEVDPIFEDSLHFTRFDERLKREQKYLKELRDNLRQHLKTDD